LIASGTRKRSSAGLRDRFGPEYDRVIESSGDRRAAEAELHEREKQRAQFDVKPLPEATRLSFAGEWRDLQERFIDQPEQAAGAADSLITRVMEERGYPMKDFDAQANLVSVDHPNTVENYRFAHAVQQRAQTQQASTEDLREALLRYRSLFDELLGPDGNGAAGATTDEAQPADYDGYDSRQRVAGGSADGPATSAIGQPDGPATGESDSAGTAAADTEYDNQGRDGTDDERR
jgi:hypothetical protein